MTFTTAILSTILSLGASDWQTTEGRLELSEWFYDFGEVDVGDSDSDSIELTNTGDIPVMIEDVDFSGDDGLEVDGGDCEGQLLEPGDSCQIDISFAPEEPGHFNGRLEVETPIGDLELDIEGDGVAL